MISQTLDAIRTLRQINRSPVEKHQRAALRRTYLRTFLLGKLDGPRKVADVVGRSVSYCSATALEYLFREIFVNNEYLFGTNTEAPVILDCGSNIGMSVLYFKWLYPNCRVTAFEPDEDAFACLARNVEANHLASVSIHQWALAKREERIPFFYDQDNRGSLTMSAIPERQPRQSREVEAVRLSAHIDGEIDFLKLDVEGSERGVLEDLVESRKLRSVKQMAIEYHHHIRTHEDALSDFLRILEGDGFGYQIGGGIARPLAREVFQDVMIYAYRKN